MISIQTTINQNERTIACMQEQDYYAAVVSASAALEYHRSIANIMQRELLQDHHQRSEFSYDQCILLTDIDMSNVDEPCDNDHGFIYQHGIALPTTQFDPDTITPILIFNAALGHYLLATQCNNEMSIKYLRRAHQLCALACEAPGMDENPLFQIAMINNAAVIDRQVDNNMDSWEATMKYLLSLYMVLVDRGCTSMLRQAQGFLMNALTSSPVAHVAQQYHRHNNTNK